MEEGKSERKSRLLRAQAERSRVHVQINSTIRET